MPNLFPLNIEQMKENNSPNLSIDEAEDFLINGCNINPSILDKQGNAIVNWRKGQKSGPAGYSKDYIPPIGWTGIGLKVIDLYDNMDNEWIGTNNNPGEWYIAYHGVKNIKAIQGICCVGFRRGDGQMYKNSPNINPLNKHLFPICKEGVYFTLEVEIAKKYTLPILYKNNNYRVVFMCRVNPYKVRIADIGNGKEFWIVEGDKLGDLLGERKIEEVRPYRILVFKDILS